jgi:hypothetical protein
MEASIAGAPFEREPSGMSGLFAGGPPPFGHPLAYGLRCASQIGPLGNNDDKQKVSGSLDGLEQPKRIGSFDRKKNVGR